MKPVNARLERGIEKTNADDLYEASLTTPVPAATFDPDDDSSISEADVHQAS